MTWKETQMTLSLVTFKHNTESMIYERKKWEGGLH